MKKQLFLLCLMVSITNVHAMEDQTQVPETNSFHVSEKEPFQSPEPVEIAVVKTMLEVNSLTGCAHVLARHISMTKGAHHFPLFENYLHAAENSVEGGITALSMDQEDPTRTAQLLESLARLKESKDNLSPMVKKMERMVKHKIRKRAFSYQVQAVEGLIDHINNAPH